MGYRVIDREYSHSKSVELGGDVYKALLSVKVRGYDHDSEYGLLDVESSEFDYKYEMSNGKVYVEVVNNPYDLCPSVMKHSLAWNGVVIVDSLEHKKEMLGRECYLK